MTCKFNQSLRRAMKKAEAGIFSDDQSKAWDEIQAFINDPRRLLHVLSGPAGAGKTFIVSKIIDWLNMSQSLLDDDLIDVYITATTHKATKVISDATDNGNATTIHNLLRLHPKEDTKSGSIKLVRKGSNNHLNENSFIICDEASMIGDDLMDEIEKAAEKRKCKFLLVGDRYQLPPVGDDDPPIFKRVENQSNLTTIKRQALDNPIIKVANDIRMVIDGAKFPKFEDSGKRMGIRCHGKQDFWKNAVDLFSSEAYKKDDNFVRMVGWTNRFVNEANHLIRGKLLGKKAVKFPYLEGEYFTCNRPVIDTKNDMPTIKTDQILKILEVNSTNLRGIKGYFVKVSYMSNNGVFSERTLFAPHSFDEADAYLRKLFNKAKKIKNEVERIKKQGGSTPIGLETELKNSWHEYFKARGEIQDLRPTHACTVHKSQGSTYTNVLVNFNDIKRARDEKNIARLLYVALTRPTDFARIGF